MLVDTSITDQLCCHKLSTVHKFLLHTCAPSKRFPSNNHTSFIYKTVHNSNKGTEEEGELNGAEALSVVCKNMQMDIMHHLKCTWFHFYLVPQGLQFFLSTQVPKIQSSFSQVYFSNWNEKHYNNTLSSLKGKLLWNIPSV